MPWCPKCKSEFTDNRTECPDCHVTLVNQLDNTLLVPSVQFIEAGEASRFVAFLEYSGITGVSMEAGEHNLFYSIRGKEEDAKEIFRLFNGFRLGEQEVEEETNEEEDSLKDMAGKEKPFVKKRDQYTDVSSTGVMLIVIGLIGILYVTLNLCGVLHFLHGIVPTILNILLFIGALIYGIYSLLSAKQLKEEADKEDQLASQIRTWLKEHVDKEFINQIPVDPSLPEELTYMTRAEALKKQVLENIDTNDIGLVEHLVEEHYQFITEPKLYEQ